MNININFEKRNKNLNQTPGRLVQVNEIHPVLENIEKSIIF